MDCLGQVESVMGGGVPGPSRKEGRQDLNQICLGAKVRGKMLGQMDASRA